MSFRRITIIVFLLGLIVPMLFSFLAGCESTPPAPTASNPFDPDSPAGGDPFNLVATLGATSITLIWDQPQGYDLVSYEVLHSNNFFGEFFSIGTVAADDEDVATFTYNDPEPTTTHYFKIQAFDSQGNFSSASLITPTLVSTLTRVIIDDGTNKVASPHISISIQVSRGDSLRVSQVGHEDSEVVLPADITGEPTILAWDLGAVESNDTTLSIVVVVQNGANQGLPNTTELDVDFKPNLRLASGGTEVASLTPTLAITDDGLESMRFADSMEALAETPWIPGSSTHDEYVLQDTANPQTIYGEFLCEFGFSTIEDLTVIPDALTDPTFYLALPESHITTSSTVVGICNANATLMRFSESLDFSSLPWEAYSDTARITLSPEAGRKDIYAQFRNQFADSPILTDYVIYVEQPPEVAITAPAEGNYLRGGTVIRVQGTSTAPSGADPVDLVMFDGGSGFAEAEGTTNWSYMWETPRFHEDTELQIRARAWTLGDWTTTVISVNITQLDVLITEPTDGTTVVGDTDVVISGTAASLFGGAAIDSVVVDIDGVRSLASGTDIWTLDWHPEAVVEEVEVGVMALVYAGEDQYSHSITLTVAPQ